MNREWKRSLEHNRALAARALTISTKGAYTAPSGNAVSIKSDMERAFRQVESLPPDRELSPIPHDSTSATQIRVTNQTTLAAAKELVAAGAMPLALNFANGQQPGGGFLLGASAQEESLCRSTCLYRTLLGQDMYAHHEATNPRDSSDWAILSPEVPVFGKDDGTLEETPWPLGILTCAAPIASPATQEHAATLMKSRIHRVLHLAVDDGYESLILGAWGCGAFGNDPPRIAKLFRNAMEGPFDGVFHEVVFAIADWSPERHTLGPFRDAFAKGDGVAQQN